MSSYYDNPKPLWDEYARTRSVSARNALVEKYLLVVNAAVKKIAGRLPPEADIDDLFSAGAIGLIRGIENFDPSREVLPQTYLSARVRGAIMDSLRSVDRVPRLIRDRRKRIDAARERFLAMHGRPPTYDELREQCKVTPQRFALMMRDAHKSETPISLSSEIDSPYGRGTMYDMVTDANAGDPSEPVERRDFVAFVIRILPPCYSIFIVTYYIEGIPMKEIGNRMGLSESRVSQIINTQMRSLRGQCQLEAA